MSNTYCPLPWVHSSLQNGNTILPCCAFMDSGEFMDQGKFEDLFFSKKMNQIRQGMLDGKKIKGCEQCYFQEQSGMESMRQRAIRKFGHVTEINVRDLNIVFDNICNLKCRMCSSGYSHLWFDEEKELYGTTFSPTKYFQNTFYREIDLSSVEHYDITGGEPLYSPHFNPFLKKINQETDVKNISIDFFTNGTIKPDNETIDILKKFKSVFITISIDAIGPLNNFIRKNSDFDDIKQNLDFYHTLTDNFSINILTTVGIYNAIFVEEIKNYFKEYYPKFAWNYDLIQYPEHLSIRNMPTELKNIYKKYIIDKSILSYMNDNADDLFGHFLNFHNDLNKIRNETLVGNDILQKFIETKIYNVSKSETEMYYKNLIKDLTGNG